MSDASGHELSRTFLLRLGLGIGELEMCGVIPREECYRGYGYMLNAPTPISTLSPLFPFSSMCHEVGKSGKT